MEKELFNVSVRRKNGNTYVDVVRAANWQEAMQIVRSNVVSSDTVLGAGVAKCKNETFWYGNFLVKRGKNGVFDVYRCSSVGAKIGRKITDADSLSKAIKKARLLQYGYEECLKNERNNRYNRIAETETE